MSDSLNRSLFSLSFAPSQPMHPLSLAALCLLLLAISAAAQTTQCSGAADALEFDLGTRFNKMRFYFTDRLDDDNVVVEYVFNRDASLRHVRSRE